MPTRRYLTFWHAPFAAVCLAAAPATAQQVADPLVDLTVASPAFTTDQGPLMMIDGAHNNFHTIDGRYEPFARLMRNDGFRLAGNDEPLSDASLANVDILVIANPVSDQNKDAWARPNPSAFTAEEIAAAERFVSNGGSLLLIADHMPFAGAAHDLGKAFGVSFDDGFAMDDDQAPDIFSLENGTLLPDPVLGDVTSVRNFTGSSFTAASGVRPLMRLTTSWRIRIPDEAWEFDETTKELSGQDRLQGALVEHGKGRVAVFAEAAMFTAQVAGPQQLPVGLRAPGAEQNKQFALNIAQWLAR